MDSAPGSDIATAPLARGEVHGPAGQGKCRSRTTPSPPVCREWGLWIAVGVLCVTVGTPGLLNALRSDVWRGGEQRAKMRASDLEAPFAKGSRSTVAELIDELPLGRFHVFHISRQILQNACVAATLEITPYIEAGIMAQFNVGGPEAFVSAFYAGSILGAALVSLQDSLGRRPVIRAGALAAVAFSFLIAAIPNYTMILVLRFLLGAGFSFQQFGFGGWFSEFLPRVNRGPLYAALTAGYPIGRALAILVASKVDSQHWRYMQLLPSGALCVVLLLAISIPESPRYMARNGGDSAGALKVVRRMYEMNRMAPPEAVQEGAVVESDTLLRGALSQTSALGAWWERVSGLRRNKPAVLNYALVLFFGISVQQSLILNLGPKIFEELLYPDQPHGPLPYSVLLVWDVADWFGILAAIAVIDRLGRKKFFFVGFVLAGLFFCIFGLLRPIAVAIDPTANPFTALIIFGALAEATRGYAPIAGNLWALESFPTEQRATCYAAVNVIYQLTGLIIVPIATAFDGMSSVALIEVYAGIQLLLGVFTMFLPNETTNKALA